MKLSKLILRNFQGHKKTVVTLVDGINAIVGESDMGKTSILRAMEMLRTNRPLGGKYYRNSAAPTGTMSIKAVFDDGLQVLLKRRIKKSKTEDGKTLKTVIAGSPEYKIKPPGGEWSSYKGFKSSVPKEVLEALNLGSINVHSQFDSSFLVSDGGAKLAKFINGLINAEEVDKWQSEANSRVRKARHQKEFATEELRSVEADLKKLESLKDLEKKVDTLTWVEAELYGVEETIDELEEAIATYKQSEETIRKKAPIVAGIQKDLDEVKTEAEELNTEWQSVGKKIIYLTDFIDLGKRITEKEKEVKRAQTSYDSILRKNKVCPYCNSTIKR